MPGCTAIALSGGIDSMVAAALLKDQGHRVFALHFLTGFETPHVTCPTAFNPGEVDDLQTGIRSKLQPIADQLDIPLYIIDLRREFKRIVVDYFIQAYAVGKTPNPCIVCNPLIKFDILFKEAGARGADHLATGHYARIQGPESGPRRLLRSVDFKKDQSYFLARLTQHQLKHILLPLGAITKQKTRWIARSRGLQPATTQESQDICFIRGISYVDFLLKQEGFKSRPGPIEDTTGRTIGQHQGLHRYTIGQRRGINCPAAEPYYVVRLDASRNCLIVGQRRDLLTEKCLLNQVHWIGSEPQGPLAADVQIRYRHKAVPAIIVPLPDDGAQVIFDQPEEAVTPGQGAVFYQDEELLGGGWIQ